MRYNDDAIFSEHDQSIISTSRKPYVEYPQGNGRSHHD